jgi:hypothetical protein
MIQSQFGGPDTMMHLFQLFHPLPAVFATLQVSLKGVPFSLRQFIKKVTY